MLSKGDWVWVSDYNPRYNGRLGFVYHDEGGEVADVEFVDDDIQGATRRCSKDRLEKLDPALYKALAFTYWEKSHVE